jgi:3-oxoacyl-[acyl-carrier-protein] synthase-1
MSAPLHIVALGARTPVGLRAESSAAAVRAGISRVRRHPFMLDGGGEPLMAAFDARLEPELLGWRRVAALAASAIAEVAGKVERSLPASERLPVLLSLPETRPGFSEADARQVAQACLGSGAHSPRLLGAEIVGRGHAGALQALGVARERATDRRGTLFLVCGVDSLLEADTLDWLDGQGRVRRAGVRNGFAPGEAAGALLLATGDASRRYSLAPFARVRGAGTGTERRTILSREESLGEGLTSAIRSALSELRLPEEAVDSVFCDINGERYRTEEWGFALLRSRNGAKTSEYQLMSGSWGDVGAASGALGCILAVQSWRRGYSKGPRALVCAGSDSGLRGAAVLESAVAR